MTVLPPLSIFLISVFYFHFFRSKGFHDSEVHYLLLDFSLGVRMQILWCEIPVHSLMFFVRAVRDRVTLLQGPQALSVLRCAIKVSVSIGSEVPIFKTIPSLSSAVFQVRLLFSE